MEARARVIFFDIAAFEADRGLQRRSSSFIPHSADHTYRTMSREHSGLMSWPENFFKARQSKQNLEGDDHQQLTNLSARAMQLGIYGSMVSSFIAIAITWNFFNDSNFTTEILSSVLASLCN